MLYYATHYTLQSIINLLSKVKCPLSVDILLSLFFQLLSPLFDVVDCVTCPEGISEALQ